MKSTIRFSFLLLIVIVISGCIPTVYSQDRGEVGTYGEKFIWTGTGQAFVPNYMMIDVLGKDLDKINEEDIDYFIQEFFQEHGFNGLHLPVFGRWFHIDENLVTEADSIPDDATFDKLEMIISKIYEAGGSTYIWMWGDAQRKWTAKSTADGIMGIQEQKLLDHIAERLGPIQGWMLGYGFDLWEWVGEEELKKWHDYLWGKPGWNHLLAARASKNKQDQIYEGLDFSDYEYHKPWFDTLVKMIEERPNKPSFSGDRYRVRQDPPSKWPEKDYDEAETCRGLWHHTMAGGVGAIWGNLDTVDGVYDNREALKCFSEFWNDHNRFRKEMIVDNSLTDGFCLKDSNKYFVFFKENTQNLAYRFFGKPKKVVVVDTKIKYTEIDLGFKDAGNYVFNAPYESDWAIAVE